ncbi:hypothetical protein MRX96_029790 [Rhipicephalus microplus]
MARVPPGFRSTHISSVLGLPVSTVGQIVSNGHAKVCGVASTLGAAPDSLRGKPGSALRASLGLPSRQQGVLLCLQPLQLHRIYIEAFLGLLGLAWWLGALVVRC